MNVDLPVHEWPLPYESRLERRAPESIDLVVVHCTELPDLETARTYGEQVHYASGTGNSGHYYIDRDGSVHLFVHPTRVAHHVRGHNAHAIGIELVNTGRYPDWHDSRRQQMDEAYPDAQITALIALLRALSIAYPTLRHIAGHEDLDRTLIAASDDPQRRIARKRDPGPMFPWERVLETTSLERWPLPD